MPVDVAAALRIRAEISRAQENENVVATGEQTREAALIDKHGRELFGDRTAPISTPPEHRYVAPGYVLVEWIGQRSPYESDTVIALKAAGKLHPTHLIMLEQAARACIPRIDGMTSRTMTPRDGFSTTYRWGELRGTYIQEMTNADADRLFACASGPEFRIVGKDATETRQGADEAWKKVFAALRRICSRDGLPMPPTDAEISRIRIKVGPTERLAGLSATSNAIGVWEPDR